MKTDKELADELDARDRLRKRGYVWKTCKHCLGINHHWCGACGGKGGRWEAPMMRYTGFEGQPPPARHPQLFSKP